MTSREKSHDSINQALDERLAYFKNRIINTLGMTNYLRQYATSSGSLTQFNPNMDKDPNYTFSAAFEGLNRVETVRLNSHNYELQYSIKIFTGNFDGVAKTFTSSVVSFPPGSDIPLNQVSSLQVSIHAKDLDVSGTELERQTVLAFSF